MEKTNSNIPTPEELKAYIDESVISVTGTYDQSASVLMVDDFTIGTLGNFSASIGKAKSKKTFNVSAIAAAALINEVVSKRWHNLFYILSSAIFSFGYAAFSSCIWQQVAIFQLYRVINSPINIYLATVMSPFLLLSV